jgi:dihydrofolate reductase
MFLSAMRSLVYLVACTVDGYIAAPEGSADFGRFEGPQVADILAEFPEMIPGHVRGGLDLSADNQRFDTVVMGRATYEVGLSDGITSPYPHLRQILATTTIAAPPDPAVEIVGTEIVEHVRALKRESGMDIWLAGGGRLAATLADELDEMILKINPLVLGAGIPLFAERIGPRALTMTQHKVYDNGYALMRYRWAS